MSALARASSSRVPVDATPCKEPPRPEPRYVVWEITLSCNLKCAHCGSRAGAARKNELTTEECRALIRELARAGTKGNRSNRGEAYLRPDWLVLVEEIARHGMFCGLQTGARALTEDKIEAAARAGLRRSREIQDGPGTAAPARAAAAFTTTGGDPPSDDQAAFSISANTLRAARKHSTPSGTPA
jgi:Radical SAM superfamily